MKCYKKFVEDGDFSRWVYFILTDRAHCGNLIWSTLKGCNHWKRGVIPWKAAEGNVIEVNKTGMQEVSELEILVITGCNFEMALEESGC